MKKFIVQTFLLLLVIGIGIIFFAPGRPAPSFDIPFLPQPPKIVNLQINDQTLKVELADTPTKRSKGLAGKEGLVEGEGMLFIFDRADKHPFWMKGLSFALDFVWIKDNKVVDILENVQPPAAGQPDSSLPIYTAKEEVDKVLELAAGTVQKLNIKIGDEVKITPP